MGQTFLAAIVSSAAPQPGQTNRSSGDFSTDAMPSDAQYVLFTVDASGPDNPNAIHFNVMQDISVGFDPVVYEDMYNNSQSRTVEGHRKLYIANPEGATQDFTVNVYAIS